MDCVKYQSEMQSGIVKFAYCDQAAMMANADLV